MKKKLYIAYFLLYNFIGILTSILGWLWEVLLFLIKDGKFANRGFLYGPWLPVYGTGAVILSLVFYQGGLIKHCRHRFKYPTIFVFCMVGGGIVEYAIGWLLWNVFHQKYWNYDGYLGSIDGYICLYSVLGFGLIGLIWILWIAPHLACIWEKLQFSMQILLVGILDTIVITDVIFSLLHPNTGKNITFAAALHSLSIFRVI